LRRAHSIRTTLIATDNQWVEGIPFQLLTS
jgi:hypothetical protein